MKQIQKTKNTNLLGKVRKTLIATIIFVTGLTTGLEFGNKSKLEELTNQNEILRESCAQQRDNYHYFISNMPNYDSLGLWLDSTYETWMIEDINERYQPRYNCNQKT